MRLGEPTDRATPEIDVPPRWRKSVEAILLHRWRKILVLGATDTGKSTYCGFLAASLQAAGRKVSFVDTDVGQKDIGPPATITATRLAKGVVLAQAVPAKLFFVGDVNPVGQFLALVVGTRKLVDAVDTDFVVIDSPGLVEGPGRVLNAYQIESLHPDVIVAIQRAGELEPTLRACLHPSILRLHPSRQAARKSAVARRRTREQSFRTYFAGGRSLVLDVKGLAVQRAPLFTGTPLHDPRFVYAERMPEGVVAIGENPVVAEQGLRVLPPDFADRLLCGVLDAQGDCLGLALLRCIDFRRRQFHLFTPVTRTAIRGLQFGSLHLDPDGRHMAHARSSPQSAPR
jgi:polynucleotide 5'-hydroxyl-kinase GRC3/NOL9